MSIGVAIIGSGIFAKEEHLPAIQGTPSLSLKAVYSRSIKSAQSLGASVPDVDLYSEDSGTGKSYADLLKRKDISGVIIALPIVVQPEYIKQALAAGKHVLAEKPIAKDVQTAQDLVSYYRKCNNGSTLGIAENLRFADSVVFAAHSLENMGRKLGFSVKKHLYVRPGTKYFETAWRKTPEYQGGFLLDGGVHFVATMRLMLGKDDQPVRVSAYTSQLQEHLPPIDSLDAIWTTSKGIHGTFSVSFGTTFSSTEYSVAAEQGTVSVSPGEVTIARGSVKETKKFPKEGSAVKSEVEAWAATMLSGKPHTSLAPEEALKDLKVLEAMIRSGESKGLPIDLELWQRTP